MNTRKIGIIGGGSDAQNAKLQLRTLVDECNAKSLDKEDKLEIVEMDKEIVSDYMNIEDDSLIQFKNPYEGLDDIYLNPSRIKRTDGERLKDHGIDSLDKLLEECIMISNKQSKLPRSIRDLVMRYSIEAYKELKLKAEEIKQESLDNIKQEENDREE